MHRTFSKFAIIGAAFAVIVGITVLISGQTASELRVQPTSPHLVGVPDDWSHHHLVFSNPGTYEQAAKDPATLAKWLAIRHDTRFILQQMKRHAEDAVSPSGLVEPEDLAIGILRQLPGEAYVRLKPKPKPKSPHSTGLWNGSLLAGTVQPNAYPAKWGASLTSASCSDDFVVYPTGALGVEGSAASIVAYNYLYYGCLGEGSPPSPHWAYNLVGTISTSPIISLDGSQVAFIDTVPADNATYLGIMRWGPGPAGTVTSPAEIEYEVAGGYRGYPLDEPGWTLLQFSFYISGTQIFTYDTYSSPFYEYLEYDSDDARYEGDVVYVGDDSGYLHMFTGVFNGNPAQCTPDNITAPCPSPDPWPVKLNPTTPKPLTSPVYDPISGNVFVGDMGGYFYAVGTGNERTTAGKVTTSAILGDAIIDGPLVDPSGGMAYVFVTTDSAGNNAVYQFPTNFTSSTIPVKVEVGKGGTGYYLYAGDFDNVYYESSTPGDPSGNLYVVGNTGGATGGTLYQIPINNNVMATTANSVVTGLTASSVPPWPSPLTEFCNNSGSACEVTTGGACGTGVTCTTSGTDYLFFSVNMGNGKAPDETGCTASTGNGCVLSYNISTPSSISSTPSGSLNVATPASPPGCWATGGIVIDNSDSVVYGAQVYFLGLNGYIAGGASVTGTVSTTNSPGVTLTGSYTFIGAEVGAIISGTGIPPGDTIASLPTSTVVTGTVSTTNSPGVTLTGSYTFTGAEVGAIISGTGIPPGDTIASVPTSTTAILKTAPTSDESTAETLTIGATITAILTTAPTNDELPAETLTISPTSCGGAAGPVVTATALAWQASQSALK